MSQWHLRNECQACRQCPQVGVCQPLVPTSLTQDNGSVSFSLSSAIKSSDISASEKDVRSSKPNWRTWQTPHCCHLESQYSQVPPGHKEGPNSNSRPLSQSKAASGLCPHGSRCNQGKQIRPGLPNPFRQKFKCWCPSQQVAASPPPIDSRKIPCDCWHYSQPSLLGKRQGLLAPRFKKPNGNWFQKWLNPEPNSHQPLCLLHFCIFGLAFCSALEKKAASAPASATPSQIQGQ